MCSVHEASYKYLYCNMKITSRKQLRFYLKADMMINRGYFKPTLKQKLINLISPDYIMEFLKAMRKVQYYSCNHSVAGYFINNQQIEIL